MQDVTIHTADLSDGALSILAGKMDYLNRRAVRFGLSPMTITVTDTREEHYVDDAGIDRRYRVNSIELAGCQPCINGWIVAARIEFTDEGNFVVSAPGIENVDHRWRTIDNQCDHCNTHRRRNDLIVIRHTDGREKIVGRNCLADYIRTEDTRGLIEFAAWANAVKVMISDARNEFAGCDGGREEDTEPLMTILQAASVCIRKLGWTSGRVSYESGGVRGSTKSDVSYLLNGGKLTSGRDAWKRWCDENDLHRNEHDRAEADCAIEWLSALDKDKVKDYLYNLCVIRDLGYVPYSKLGYAVSIIIAAKKDRDEEIKRKEYATKSADKVFVGCVGQREKGLDVTVKRVRHTEGDYGVITIITFVMSNDDCAELTWFASGDKSEDFVEGETYTVDAFIKAHDDSEQYGKNTKINRVTKKKVCVA